MALSNDHAELVPRTEFDGPVLEFDFETFKIGVAEYDEGPTGCTVFHFPKGAACNIDVRGGSVGLLGDYGWTNAICIAGGSLYGLEAATGVAAELLAIGGYSGRWQDIALASGAIIYDFGGRDNAIYPDKNLGRAALRSAGSNRFPLGARGAGRSATVGKAFDFKQAEPGGQGGAFRQIGPTKIAAFCVVNAMGAILDRQGRVVRGNLDHATGERRSYHEQLEAKLAAEVSIPNPQPGNTTPSVIITNQRLGERALQQLARQVHGLMNRAIQPFHTMDDGDVLFAVSTNEVENKSLNLTALADLASEVMWDALLHAF